MDAREMQERCARVAEDIGVPYGPWQKIEQADTFDNGARTARRFIVAAIRTIPCPAVAPAPAAAEVEAMETTAEERKWLRDMFEPDAPRFNPAEIAHTEEIIQRYHRDFDRLLRRTSHCIPASDK